MKRLALLLLACALALAVPSAAQAAPPTGLTGMALDGRVELAWQPAAGAESYNVYRGTSPTTVTTPVSLTGVPAPPLSAPATFTDTTAVNGTDYWYAVRAVIGGVESANSRLLKATPAAASCASGNVVVEENCFPGETEWGINPYSTGIAGFATKPSIDHGESVELKVQSGTPTVNIQIFRNGHYGGAGARLYSTMVDVPVAPQPGCANEPSLGLSDCSTWTVTDTVTTTANWPSGIYLARISRSDTNAAHHILFVVRDDGRSSDVLYGLPDTTYQAYNNFGGKSLYNHNSGGGTTVSGQGRAVKVSFDRPYMQQHDTAAHDWYTKRDYATIRWLEREGYDVAYSAASDLERLGSEVDDHRVYISGVHDEYYSAAMRSALEQARNAGTDLFFTGANELYWKVRFEQSTVSGRQDRVLVCYKTTQSGPADPSGIHTGTWRDPAGANQPENALSGVMYVGQRDYGYFPLQVSSAQGQDPIWRHTGLESLPAGQTATIGTSLVGWEWDARVANGAEPPGVVELSGSPVNGDILQDAGRTYAPGSTISHAVKKQWPSGALVVSTGTNHWNWGLARNDQGQGEPERRIQQATTNILVDMGATPDTPAGDIVLDDPGSAPTVTQRTPAAGASGVAPIAVVRATFSRAMDASTINSSSFKLTGPGGAVPASVSYDAASLTATLTPSAALSFSSSYTARLEPTIRAANGAALGSAVSWSFTTAAADTTPPSVAITAPANGATVVGSADLAATATDNAAVAGVQFKLDGQNLGAEDTTSPYGYAWDARSVSAGNHQLSAVARDSSGNTASSAVVNVTVDPSGLVAAYGFEETSGASVTDRSGKGNGGTISGATRSASGRHGRALSFDGVNDWVTVPDSATLDLTNAMTVEAWVRPSVSGGWRTVLMKEQPGGIVYGLYGSEDTNRPSAHIFTNQELDTRGTSALATSTWTHLASTYDGTTLRLYVNGAQVSSRVIPGPIATSTGALRIGGNSVWGEYLAGLIDEVRVYRRVLGASEIQTDMATPIVPTDTQPPTAPSGLTANGSTGQAQLGWNAATDNVGVAHYNVHRSTTSGFTPSTANRVAQVTGTSYTNTGVPAGTHYYKVTAEDAAGNIGPSSNQASAVVSGDTTAPTVSLTAPAAGATVSGSVTVSANASDNVGVAGVQFRANGQNIGAEDTSSPWSTTWSTTGVANGTYTLTAVARDAAGNTTTSASRTVTVSNAPVDPTGLVAAFGFEETSGTAVTDSSGRGNGGTISGATRSTAGRFGRALSFDGVNDLVTVADASSLDLTTGMTLEAWVRPTALSGWRTVLLKEQTNGLVYALYANEDGERPSGHIFTSSEVDTRGSAALATNTWTHLAATYDGGTLRLYIDGTQASTRAVSGSLLVSGGALRIGGNNVWPEWFTGLIDEVRVYSRALSATEIQTDMGRAVLP